MKRQEGYGRWTDRQTGKTQGEMDTVKCRHCQTTVFVKPGTVCTTYLIPDRRQPPGHYLEEPGAWCPQCNGPICLVCHDQGICTPFMRLIELQESKQALVDQIARLRL